MPATARLREIEDGAAVSVLLQAIAPVVRSRSVRRWSALVGAAALCAALASSGAATPVAKLRERQSALAAQQSAAALELYALETKLARADARLAALRAQRDAVESQLARLRVDLNVAWRAVYYAQEQLGARIRQLYENGHLDPVAILLGADSLDDALGDLEGLRSLAAGDRDLLAQVRHARDDLRRAKTRVRARAAALRAAENQAIATAAALREAASARRAFIATLVSERGLTRRQIARLEATARTARRKSATVTRAAPAAAAAEAAPEPEAATIATALAAGERQLTVVATGYSIRGTTATGLPTARGVVAVDPSVIPLGTKLSIPGYGEGVAADTGGAVRGNVIDLWFPSLTEALAWGRRTVTITLHG